jgi:hypothetical protein
MHGQANKDYGSTNKESYFSPLLISIDINQCPLQNEN